MCGGITMDWFLNLDAETQLFIKNFMVSSGSLKRLAEIYGVSYPTVRLRLNQVIYRIQMLDEQNTPSFEAKVMHMVEDNRLTLETAKQIIEDYKDEFADIK
nr:DUF2089 family protein [Periweissella ghanensis]